MVYPQDTDAPKTENGLFSFEGRVSRSTYWVVSIIAFVVFQIAIGIFAPALQRVVMRGSMPGIEASLAVIVFSVPFLWVLLAVAVKRWHDRDQSGWMNLIALIPVLNLWALVELGFLRGTVGANQYGPDPIRGANTTDVSLAMDQSRPIDRDLPVAKPIGDPIQNSIGMELMPIPAGEFMMGSRLSAAAVAKQFDVPPSISENEHPLHHVKLTKSFHLGRTEVTQGQWQAVMNTTPWLDKVGDKVGDDYAATFVSWEDSVEFCRKLSEKESSEYRLPTEAEWEYACRAGTTTEYSFGANASLLGDYAWYDKNTFDAGENFAHRVGEKQANPWGLYDMHGNVWEWCQDWFAPYQSDAVTDAVGPDAGSERVSRGGCWDFGAWRCRSANRSGFASSLRYRHLGFRVLCSSG